MVCLHVHVGQQGVVTGVARWYSTTSDCDCVDFEYLRKKLHYFFGELGSFGENLFIVFLLWSILFNSVGEFDGDVQVVACCSKSF